MISCLIVNFNCLFHTKNLIEDLKRQTIDYDLTIVDQNSQESGTVEYFSSLPIKFIRNNYNKPLNSIWNEFVTSTSNEICCFLNNDIRIPKNFLHDTSEIFSKESDVSCVIHPTNHPDWNVATKKLNYIILNEKIRQGWDFSFRRNDWVNIPSILDFYCGDDFIFENVYSKNKKVAVALSSPIIHLLSQTRKSPLNKIIPNRNPNKDIENYKGLGYQHYLDIPHKYSKISPEISSVREEI